MSTLKDMLLRQGKNGLVDSIIQSCQGDISDKMLGIYFAKFIIEFTELENAWNKYVYGKRTDKFCMFGSRIRTGLKNVIIATNEIMIDMRETLDTISDLGVYLNTSGVLNQLEILYGELEDDISNYIKIKECE